MTEREEIKAEIIRQIEAKLERMLGDDQTVAEMTLSEIEEAALTAGSEIGSAVMTTLVAVSEKQGQKGKPDCPVCGQAMRHKGYRKKTVIARAGEVSIRRAYYYCENCREGLFPPG